MGVRPCVQITVGEGHPQTWLKRENMVKTILKGEIRDPYPQTRISIQGLLAEPRECH